MSREDFSLMMRSVVEAMTFPMVITEVTLNGDGTQSIVVCNLYHAEPGRVVTIDSNSYTIVSIDDEHNVIVLSAGPAIVVSTFDLYGVHYFDGSPMAVEKEIRDIPDATDKTPMIFLLNPYKERKNKDVTQAIDRRTTCTLFFLTQANFDKWTTGDLQANAVRPMGRLKERFEESIDDDWRFFTGDQEWEDTPRVKFGVFITNAGVKKGFGAMDLSGMQGDTIFSIYDTDCGMPSYCIPFTTPEPEPESAWDSSFDSSFS